MSSVECVRRIEFDAAHRVIGHENKCKYVHGHRYVLEISAESDSLNGLGMVVDFGVLKSIMKGWIDKNLDHNIILSEEDKSLGDFVSNYTGQDVYYISSNPTAENIALHIKDEIIPQIFDGYSFKIKNIKLYETPNCYVLVN